jgi:hypothetical protein
MNWIKRAGTVAIGKIVPVVNKVTQSVRSRRLRVALGYGQTPPKN